MSDSIVLYNDIKIRMKSQPVLRNIPMLQELITRMRHAMVLNNGIGLSANQIGELYNIFVVSYKNQEYVVINPTVISTSQKIVYGYEGCLSIPDMYSHVVPRHEWICIEYFDENWKKHREKFDGMMARVFQHEIDHLQGKLYVDLINVKNLKKG